MLRIVNRDSLKWCGDMEGFKMNKRELWLLKIIIAVACFMAICLLVQILFCITFMILPIGLIFIIIAAGELISNSQERQYGSGGKNNSAGLRSLFSGVICCLYAALSCIQLYIYGYGHSIRPMGWSAFVFFVGIIAIAFGLSFSIIGLMKDKDSKYSCIGLVLAFSPFFVSMFLLHLGVWLGIYTLSP